MKQRIKFYFKQSFEGPWQALDSIKGLFKTAKSCEREALSSLCAEEFGEIWKVTIERVKRIKRIKGVK